MDWFKENLQEPQLLNGKNLWFPVNFPFNQRQILMFDPFESLCFPNVCDLNPNECLLPGPS